jgi:hypothetical protein
MNLKQIALEEYKNTLKEQQTSNVEAPRGKQIGKPLSIEDLEFSAEQGDEVSVKILSKLADKKVREIVKEQNIPTAHAPGLIKVDVALKYEKNFTFYGNVLNQIRSIKGITIAKASDIGVVDVGPDRKMVLLHLKFMPDRPLYQYLTYLQMELKKMKDEDGNRVLATRVKGVPKKIAS